MTTTTNYVVDAPKQHETSNGVSWMTHLYLDGKKLAMVENSGHGGCDNYSWFADSHAEIVKLEEAYFNVVKAWTAIHAPEFQPEGDYAEICKFGGLGDYATHYIEHLMQKAEYAKKLRAQCKREVCMRKPGQTELQHSFFKGLKPTAENIAAVKAKHPDCTILN